MRLMLIAAALFLAGISTSWAQFSNAQTIAALGGRVVGAAKACKINDDEVSRTGAKVLIVANSRLKKGETGVSPDTLFSTGYDEGRNEVVTGRTKCSVVAEAFRDLNAKLASR